MSAQVAGKLFFRKRLCFCFFTFLDFSIIRSAFLFKSSLFSLFAFILVVSTFASPEVYLVKAFWDLATAISADGLGIL